MNGTALQYDTSRGFKQIKGGQTENTTFVQSIMQSHYNIVYNPLVCLYAMIAISTTVYYFYDMDGPLEYLRDLMSRTMSDTKAYPVVKTVANLAFNVTSFLIKYKSVYIKFSLVSIPVCLKPSFINILFTFLLFFVTLVFHEWTVINIGVVAYLWFLFTQIRNPAYKFVIVSFASFLFFYCWVSKVELLLNPLSKSANSTKAKG